MAQQRNLSESTIQHVFNRGVDRQDIFETVGDRSRLLEFLAEGFELHEVRLHAFALMTNHLHFLVEMTEPAGLSAAMRSVEGRYARSYNVLSERSGPLFTGRFKNVAVTSTEQFMTASRYIDRNPIDIVGAERVSSYRWSSLGAHAGTRPCPTWLETTRLAPLFESGDAYLRFVLAPQPSDRLANGPRPPLRPTTLAEIDQAVSETLLVPTAELRNNRNHASSIARTLAMTVAIDTRAGTALQIAQHYGLAQPSSVRKARARGAASVSRRSHVAAMMVEIMDRLHRLPRPAFNAEAA